MHMTRFRATRLYFLLAFFTAAAWMPAAFGVDVKDPLTDPKHPNWIVDRAEKTGGSVSVEAGGAVLKSEPRNHAMLKRSNEIVGTDANPLEVSVYCISTPGYVIHPGLHLYWDNANYVSLLFSVDNHLHLRWTNKNIDSARDFYNIVPDSKKNGVYLRLTVTTRNVLVSMSMDGENWQRLGDIGGRPGKEGVAPPKILLGRGWSGEKTNKDARPDLCNDYYPDGAKDLVTSTFRNFSLRDTPYTIPGDDLKLEARDNWEQAEESLEPMGVPKNWTVLGPRPDVNYAMWGRKEGFDPDTTDDWSKPQKDENGKSLRVTQWSRPDDDKNCYVDMGEILELNTSVIAWARTEVEWPDDGPANLFFDDNGRAVVYLNNKVVFSDAGREMRGASKDKFCVPVHMNRGRNVIKVKTAQSRGDWGFFLRVDRTDPGFRIKTLEKLIELHPQEAGNWRGADALFEIARRYQQLNNFPAALAAWQKGIEKFATNDEQRVEAFAGKIRLLALLRDWDALAATGGEYLTKYGRARGSKIALDACVTGETLSGKVDAAEARVKKWVEDSGAWGEQIDWSMRLLAGAQGEAGLTDRQFATLERLADNPALTPMERATAAFESAFNRYRMEYDRVNRGEKMEPEKFTAACAAARKGLAVLPGATNPQVQAWTAEAEADLKAGRHERALAGFWGAALLSMAASDPETAPYLALTRAFTLPSVSIDPKTNKPRDLNDQVRGELWKPFGEAVGDTRQIGNGNWKAIGPFDYDPKNPPGPEKNPDLNAKHPGRGGEKAWVEMDPAKCSADGGLNIKAVIGDCRGGSGVAYTALDFEAPQAKKTFFIASARAAWVAWLDGKQIASRGEDGLNIDGYRVPIELTKGPHRILMRLAPPGDDNFIFRVRVDTEPELAIHLLRMAWIQREFPNPAYLFTNWGDASWLLNFCQYKVPPGVLRDFGESLSAVFVRPDLRWACSYLSYDYLKRTGQQAEAANAYKYLLRRIETSSSFGDQMGQIWYATNQTYDSLVNCGETAAADEVLRDFIASYPDFFAGTGSALVWRGILRQDFAQTQASRAFFERAIREYPQSSDNFRFAAPGLAYSRKYMPDRLIYSTADDAQAAVDVGSRLMKTGDPADIEKAMSKFGEMIRSNSDSLISISDSRFFPRLVGVREYVRAFISALNDDARDVYLKTVAGSSDQAFRTAARNKDVVALENVAAEYQYTPAAMQALNLAGNLYFDRGDAQQAASAFRALARQNRGSTESGISPAMLAAKTVRALLRSGQIVSARAALDTLNGEFAGQSFTVGGQSVTGAQYAKVLNGDIERVAATQQKNSDAPTETHLGNTQRRGPPAGSPAPKPGEVSWVRPLPPSASMDVARWRFVPDPFVHLQPFPAVSGGNAYITTMESMQAIELQTGRNLWQATWPSSGSLVPGRFTGFPVSCPTVSEGRVYARALLGKHSALQCIAADSGKVLWNTADIPELRNAVWINDPLIAYGLCIACYLEPADLNCHGVAALDAVTGRLRWKHALATGGTGIEVQGEYFGSTMQLGPAAADERVVYAITGLGSLAALNALTGEVIWLSGYPRAHIGNWDVGNSNSGTNVRLRTLKLLSRGPVSPIVTPDTILVAPKDAPGLIAFDRANGSVKWEDELLDAPYLAGICNGNVITVGNAIRAIQIKDGSTAWEYAPSGESIYGQPGISGEIIYLPTEDHLHLVDAKTGKVQTIYAWDPRVGPLGNLTITNTAVIGVNGRSVAAIGAVGSPKVELPVQEARVASAAGKFDAAASLYAKAEQSSDVDVSVLALNDRIRALERMGHKEEGQGDVDRVLAGKPAMLDLPSEQWRVSRDTLAEVLHARTGQPGPPPAAPPQGLQGALSFAWQLEGESAMTCFPADGPQDRFLAYTGTSIYMLRLSPKFEVLWQSYAGPGMTSIQTNATTVCVANSQQITFFDRDSGQPLWRTGVPRDRKRRTRGNATWLQNLALSEDAVAIIGGEGLFVYDIRSGKELWSNERGNRFVTALSFQGEALNIVQMYGNDQPAYFTSYDAHAGNMISSVQFKAPSREKWSIYDRISLSPDKKVLYVFPTGVDRFIGMDMTTGLNLWDSESLFMHADNSWNALGVDAPEGLIFYHGHRDNHFYSFYYDRAGKLVSKQEGLRLAVGGAPGNFVAFGDKIVARQATDDKGVLKELWKTTLAAPYADANDVRKVFLSNNRLYEFVVRANWGVPDHIVLRTFDWETGLVVAETLLPGTPIRNTENKLVRASIEQRGNMLLYAVREGFFAYSPVADTQPNSLAKLKATLSQKDLPSAQRRDARRALNEIEPSVFQLSPAPAGTRLDNENSDPVMLDTAEQYVPFTDEQSWQGPHDLSAKIYSAWSNVGIALAIEVKDDRFVPPQPGHPLESGDSIRIAFNGLTDPVMINRSENVVITMALVDGRVVINTEHEASEEEQGAVTGRITPAPDGKGARYEVMVPWQILRHDPRFRPGDRKELRLGIVINDNDGDGVKGALEFGAGLTNPSLVPAWLARVSLVDISKEKGERYRKVIAKLPGAPQSMSFLNQILSAKRGANPEKERATELEEFIKAHPDTPNTIPALRLLRHTYVRMGGPNDWNKTVEFAKSVKCPPSITDTLTGKYVSVWVLPDEKNPPKTVMLQINVKGWGWARRAYWGERRPELEWGRDATSEHFYMGPLPKPGQWTQLVMNAIDFEMNETDIQSFGVTSFGGLTHWEQGVAMCLGKETALLPEALPKDIHMDGNPIVAVDNPHHALKKSWTGNPTGGVLNSSVNAPDVWFSFKTPKPEVKVDPKAPPPKAPDNTKEQALYREMAGLVFDTGEAKDMIGHVIELSPQEKRLENAISEVEDFLTHHPETVNANAMLQELQQWYAQKGDKFSVKRCDDLIRNLKLPRNVSRVFYSQYSPTWMEWQVLGPFQATSDRRGQDQFMAPEKAVDLTWRTKAAGDIDVGWRKYSAAKDDKGNPNTGGFVDLYPPLFSKLDNDTRGKLEKGPYFGYAYARFTVPTKRKALLLFGANDIVSIWVNGRRVVNEAAPGNAKDCGAVEIPLTNGPNEILIKPGVTQGHLGFFCRIADERGRPFDDVTQ